MYLTAPEYQAETGVGLVAEKLDAILEQASRLLDSRIGVYERITVTTGSAIGWKLDHEQDEDVTTFPDLDDYQAAAVRTWVAKMTEFLIDYDGKLGGEAESIQLGKFRRTSSKREQTLRDHMAFPDSQLVDAGLVNRAPISETTTV